MGSISNMLHSLNFLEEDNKNIHNSPLEKPIEKQQYNDYYYSKENIFELIDLYYKSSGKRSIRNNDYLEEFKLLKDYYLYYFTKFIIPLINGNNILRGEIYFSVNKNYIFPINKYKKLEKINMKYIAYNSLYNDYIELKSKILEIITFRPEIVDNEIEEKLSDLDKKISISKRIVNKYKDLIIAAINTYKIKYDLLNQDNIIEIPTTDIIKLKILEKVSKKILFIHYKETNITEFNGFAKMELNLFDQLLVKMKVILEVQNKLQCNIFDFSNTMITIINIIQEQYTAKVKNDDLLKSTLELVNEILNTLLDSYQNILEGKNDINTLKQDSIMNDINIRKEFFKQLNKK